MKTGSNDPAGLDLVVNATPLGMDAGAPLPVNTARLKARTFVGEVVMKTEMTAFLAAAQARGCRVQVGTDMLFEMVPLFLEFFRFPTATAEKLRAVAWSTFSRIAESATGSMPRRCRCLPSHELALRLLTRSDVGSGTKFGRVLVVAGESLQPHPINPFNPAPEGEEPSCRRIDSS